MNHNPMLRFHVLVDWLEGRLDESTAQEVERAVAGADDEARETVAWIEEFLDVSRSMPLVAPPQELSERLHDVFDELHAPARRGTWSDADLRHDSRLHGTAGVRSGVTGETGHLVYHSESVEVLLEVIGRNQRELDIRGQIQDSRTGVVVGGATVALMLHGELTRVTRTGDDGRFALAGLPDGVDELWITRGVSRVRLTIDLTAR